MATATDPERERSQSDARKHAFHREIEKRREVAFDAILDACRSAANVLAAIDDEFSGINLTYEQGHEDAAREALAQLRAAIAAAGQ